MRNKIFDGGWMLLIILFVYLFVWVSWDIDHCRLFYAKSILSILTVLFQIIPFSISIQFSSIWPIGATTPGQSWFGSDGNEVVLRIPQNPSITETSPADCFASYPGHLLEESYVFPEVHSVYTTAPTERQSFDWLCVYIYT